MAVQQEALGAMPGAIPEVLLRKPKLEEKAGHAANVFVNRFYNLTRVGVPVGIAVTLVVAATLGAIEGYNYSLNHLGPKAKWTEDVINKLEGRTPLAVGEEIRNEKLIIVPTRDSSRRLPRDVEVADYPYGGILAPRNVVGMTPLGAKIEQGAILTGIREEKGYAIFPCNKIDPVTDVKTGKPLKLNPSKICVVNSIYVDKAK